MPTARRTAPRNGRTALACEFADVARLFRSLFDPYRPELHYMRGPGPKWHAKHRSAPTEAHDALGLLRLKA
jgi:hypothetical protein